MIIGVFGITGSGKSYYIKNNVINSNKNHNFYIMDITGEYKLLKESNKKKYNNLYIYKGDNLINFIQEVYILKTKNKIIIIEEAEYFNSLLTPAEKKEFNNLIYLHRHQAIDIYFIAKRFAHLPQILLSNTERFIIFKIVNRYDKKYVENSFDIDSAVINNIDRYKKIEYNVYDNKIKQGKLWKD